MMAARQSSAFGIAFRAAAKISITSESMCPVTAARFYGSWVTHVNYCLSKLLILRIAEVGRNVLLTSVFIREIQWLLSCPGVR